MVFGILFESFGVNVSPKDVSYGVCKPLPMPPELLLFFVKVCEES